MNIWPKKIFPLIAFKNINANRININNESPIAKKNIHTTSFDSLNSCLLCFLVTFIVFVTPIQATTVICILKDGTITIGADSRATIANITDTTFVLNCKIFQVDSFFVAFSGISDYRSANFFLTDIAKQTLFGNRHFKSKIKSFQDSLYIAFSNAMLWLSINRPNFFWDNLQKMRCSVMIVGMENSIPFVYVIQYKSVPVGVLGYEIDKMFKGHYSTTTGIIFMGERDFIYDFTKTDSTYWKKNDPIDVINFFIGLEIRNNPVVEGPIDILQINGKGWEWIQRKKTCYQYDKKT